MAAITTAQAGNWSSTSTWTGGVVPGNGDTVTINHNVTVDTNTTVGTSGAAGTLVIQVASGKDLTVNSSVTLTVRGDTRLENGTLTMAAGSTYEFDSSLASGTPYYKIRFGSSGSQAGSKIICNGSSGSHVTFKKATGSQNGLIGRFTNGVTAWCSINATYTDFSSLGKTSTGYDNDAIEINANGSGTEFVFDHCTFTACGRVMCMNCLAGNDLSVKFCLFDSGIGTAKYDLWLNCAATTGGERLLTDNVWYSKASTRFCVFESSVKEFTCERNVFGQTLYSNVAGTGAMTYSQDNLWFQRSKEEGMFGEPGGTVFNCYLIGDVGGEQGYIAMFSFQSGSGRCTYDGFIYENTSSNIDSDLAQALLPTVALTHRHIRALTLPNSAGYMSGNLTAHGNANMTLEYEHNTMMSAQPGGGTGDAAFYQGSGYAGHAGMVAYCRSNLVWAKSRPSQDGWIIYDASGTVTDVTTPSGLDYNATYNLNNGTVYDSAGANGVTTRGYQGFRLSNQTIGQNDVTLTDGSDEQTEGPMFFDPTRYFVTFDSVYLENSATAWADATSYSVGDIVSASDSGFYEGAIVNFRCVTAHTSSAGHATNGKPGVASSFRTNWEPASYYRIRQAILNGTTITDASLGLTNASYIKTVHTWVREGWRPTNPILDEAAHDGTTIGATDFLFTAPEISVLGNSVEIADGDGTPTTTDHTDFGSILLGNTQDRTFTISNTGNAELTISGSPRVVISGTHAADFSLTSSPDASISPDGTTTFTIRFTPSATGLRTADLSITNNDSDESPYNFSIQGTGTAREMNVTGNGVSIADGDSTPSVTDDTDFGVSEVGEVGATHTFTIENTGNATLSLSGTPRVVIGGTHAADFVVDTQPSATVAAGGNTTFVITFTAGDNGLRTATVSIDNDDTDENPYNFSIQGTGMTPSETAGPQKGKFFIGLAIAVA